MRAAKILESNSKLFRWQRNKGKTVEIHLLDIAESFTQTWYSYAKSFFVDASTSGKFALPLSIFYKPCRVYQNLPFVVPLLSPIKPRPISKLIPLKPRRLKIGRDLWLEAISEARSASIVHYELSSRSWETQKSCPRIQENRLHFRDWTTIFLGPYDLPDVSLTQK